MRFLNPVVPFVLISFALAAARAQAPPAPKRDLSGVWGTHLKTRNAVSAGPGGELVARLKRSFSHDAQKDPYSFPRAIFVRTEISTVVGLVSFVENVR